MCIRDSSYIPHDVKEVLELSYFCSHQNLLVLFHHLKDLYICDTTSTLRYSHILRACNLLLSDSVNTFLHTTTQDRRRTAAYKCHLVVIVKSRLLKSFLILLATSLSFPMRDFTSSVLPPGSFTMVRGTSIYVHVPQALM